MYVLVRSSCVLLVISLIRYYCQMYRNISAFFFFFPHKLLPSLAVFLSSNMVLSFKFNVRDLQLYKALNANYVQFYDTDADKYTSECTIVGFPPQSIVTKHHVWIMASQGTTLTHVHRAVSLCSVMEGGIVIF